MSDLRAVTLDRRNGGLAQAVYDELKERLLDGRHAAGERLSVEALRAEFGLSRQPVMDAVRRLSGDGLVNIVPQVGTTVATYTLREIDDFFVLFGGFEGTITGIAATRRTTGQLAQLDDISARIDALRGTANPAERAHGYRVLNRSFHQTIHDMAQSGLTSEISHKMWDLSDFLINTTGVLQPLTSALDNRHMGHEAIRHALHAGDQALARTETERHIVGIVPVIHGDADSAAVPPAADPAN